MTAGLHGHQETTCFLQPKTWLTSSCMADTKVSGLYIHEHNQMYFPQIAHILLHVQYLHVPIGDQTGLPAVQHSQRDVDQLHERVTSWVCL